MNTTAKYPPKFFRDFLVYAEVELGK